MILKISTFFIPLIILLTSANCNRSQTPTSLDFTLIKDKLWLHSYEEDSSGFTTYRPQEYEFPPSRGRKGFKIQKDSLFILYSIAPTDGWAKHNGKWTLKNNKTLEVNFSDKELVKKKWEIIKLSQDIILIKDQTEN